MIERLVRGHVPAKHHVAFRGDGGELRHEECITRAGFDGPYTIAYHLRRPHVHTPVELEHGWSPPSAGDRPGLRRRHFKTPDLARHSGSPVDARVPLLFNDDIIISMLCPDRADPVYFANGDGDDLFYIHRGGGVLHSVLGRLEFEEEDYVHIPRGLIHRFEPMGGEQVWLSIETAGALDVPKQWRNGAGQLRMDAPFCHRDFRSPNFVGPIDEGIRDLVVKRAGRFQGFRFPDSPLDVVGWDGTVYPSAFPILNFQPRAGLVHLPPTWHGTFASRGTLICSFVPRVVDFHPEAIPCPYPHAALDCDEFLFYARGNFVSRRGVGPGSFSFHPSGVTHGPHPGAYEGSIGHDRTDELAVMVDTFKPLQATAAAESVEDAGYHDSFA